MKNNTKRPQNMCYNCWYTWYPRGKNISNICPNCGSRSTGIDLSSIVILLIVLVILFLVL